MELIFLGGPDGRGVHEETNQVSWTAEDLPSGSSTGANREGLKMAVFEEERTLE